MKQSLCTDVSWVSKQTETQNLKKLENPMIPRNWVAASAHPPFHKQKPANSGQKLRKSIYAKLSRLLYPPPPKYYHPDRRCRRSMPDEVL